MASSEETQLARVGAGPSAESMRLPFAGACGLRVWQMNTPAGIIVKQFEEGKND